MVCMQEPLMGNIAWPKLLQGDSKRIRISKDTVKKIAQVGCSILVVRVIEAGYVSGCLCYESETDKIDPALG